jgi:tetratricopeptide (TPR) repeat protein
LQHPNIVQIFEVAEHDGLPYLALEYLDGGSLAQRLVSTTLHPRDAAQLIETLARAVDYAHERGIIHRDLKPANILFQKSEVRSQKSEVRPASVNSDFCPLTSDLCPKITDFGLAKRLDDASGQTHTGQVMGTPSYMAPEQAAGLGHRVGPAADVYALGAILYELLAGRPPFRAASSMATLQQVLSQEPVAPARFQPGVPRDLETICLRCLHKEPRRRYASAGQLADDLRRFLEGRPVLARRTPIWERTWKWARRRPAVAGMIAITVAASLSLVLGGLWSYSKIGDALSASRHQENRAKENFVKARESVRRLTQVARDRLGYLPRMEQEQRAILNEALKFYDELRDEDRADPAIRRDLGQIHMMLSGVEERFGNLERAEDLCHKSLAVYEQLLAAEPDNPEYANDTANALNRMAGVSDAMGRYAEAEAQCREVLSRRQKLAIYRPDNDEFQNKLGTAHYNLALLLRVLKRNKDAEDSFGIALKILKALAEQHPRTAIYQDDLAAAYLSLGAVLDATGRHAEAEKNLLLAIACHDALEQIDPDHAARPFHRLEIARTWRWLANVRRVTGQLEAAKSAYGSAIEIGKKLAADHPTVPAFFFELDLVYGQAAALLDEMKMPVEEINREAMRSWGRFPEMVDDRSRSETERAVLRDSWGRRLLRTGQYAKAEQTFRLVLEQVKKLHSTRLDIPRYRRELAAAHENLAIAVAAQQREPEAIKSIRESIELYRELASEFPDFPDDRSDLTDVRDHLAQLLKTQAMFEDAENLVRENVALWAELKQQFPDVLIYRENWAHALDSLAPYLHRNGRAAENESIMREELAAFESLGRDFPRVWKYARFTSTALNNLANLLERQHRFAEAERAHRSALAVRKHLASKVPAIPYHHQLVGHSYFNLGLLLMESEGATKAEPELLQARTQFETLHHNYRKDPDYRYDLAGVCNSLGNLWRMQDKPQEAKMSWEKALALQKGLVDEHPLVIDYQYEYALSQVNLGGLLATLRQAKEAEALFRQGIQILALLCEKQSDAIAYRTGLGEAHGMLGRLFLDAKNAAGARTHLEQSLVHLKQALDVDPKQPRFAVMRGENYRFWIEALLLAKDHKAAAKAAPELSRLFPKNGEGAFLAAKCIASCLMLAEQDASLSIPDRNVLLRAYSESALDLLRKTPPPSKRLQEIKRSPEFEPLRNRDNFRKWLDSTGEENE